MVVVMEGSHFFCFGIGIISSVVVYLSFMEGMGAQEAVEVIKVLVGIFLAYVAYQYNNHYKNQKELQRMEMKREYYNKFLEAFMRKMFYTGALRPEILHSLEAAKANEMFCIEVSRLSSYASKEVMIFVEQFQNQPQTAVRTQDGDPRRLFALIRKDLGMGDGENLQLYPQIPNQVIINNEVLER